MEELADLVELAELDTEPSKPQRKGKELPELKLDRPCQKCKSSQSLQKKLVCKTCFCKEIEYIAKLSLRKVIPDQHSGLLIVARGHDNDTVLANVLREVRNCHQSKIRRGIQARLEGVLLVEGVVQPRHKQFLQHLQSAGGIKYHLLEGQSPDLEQFAKKLQFQFVLQSTSCDMAAQNLMTDLMQGKNPLRSNAILPLESVLQQDLADYSALNGLAAGIGSVPKTGVSRLTSQFLIRMQAQNSHTMRTVTKMKEKLVWQQ